MPAQADLGFLAWLFFPALRMRGKMVAEPGRQPEGKKVTPKAKRATPKAKRATPKKAPTRGRRGQHRGQQEDNTTGHREEGNTEEGPKARAKRAPTRGRRRPQRNGTPRSGQQRRRPQRAGEEGPNGRRSCKRPAAHTNADEGGLSCIQGSPDNSDGHQKDDVDDGTTDSRPPSRAQRHVFVKSREELPPRVWQRYEELGDPKHKEAGKTKKRAQIVNAFVSRQAPYSVPL